MYIETNRLIIRDLIPDDAPSLLEMHSDPEVMRYLAGSANAAPPTLESSLKSIERLRALGEKQTGMGFWAVTLKDSGEFLGLCGLMPLDQTTEIEIAYRYRRGAWGKGYATEAAQAVLDYGLNVAELQEIAGITMPENVASRRVLEKIGLTYQGMAKFYGCDVTYYKIVRRKE